MRFGLSVVAHDFNQRQEVLCEFQDGQSYIQESVSKKTKKKTRERKGKKKEFGICVINK